jgi:hypothetical protein
MRDPIASGSKTVETYGVPAASSASRADSPLTLP